MLVCKYVDENGSGAMLTAKRSAGVVPEVNIRECITSLMPLPNANNPHQAGFETQRRHQQMPKTGTPQKDICPPKIKKKNNSNKNMVPFFVVGTLFSKWSP